MRAALGAKCHITRPYERFPNQVHRHIFRKMTTPSPIHTVSAKPGQVVAMISSTSEDLILYRDAAKNACLKCDVFPVGMEELPAKDQSGIDASLAMVEKCDILIGIYAWRYGWVPEGSDISITHMEYRHAEKRKAGGHLHEILIFLIDEEHPVIPRHKEDGEKAQAELKKLKAETTSQRIRKVFTTPEQLEGQIIHALKECLPAIQEKVAARPAVTLPAQPDISVAVRSVPYDRNPHLTDREGQMARLDSFVERRTKGDSAKAAVIVGDGGIGKTQLAANFAHRISGTIQVFLFINAETPELLRDNLVAFAGPRGIGLPGIHDTPPDATLAELRAWLCKNDRWFLVFENVDTALAQDAVRTFIEGTAPGQRHDPLTEPLHRCGVLIITGRHWTREIGYDLIELSSFQPEVGADFLCGRCEGKGGTHGEARALSEALYGLPLAHEQAASYIRRHGMAFTEYLADYHQGIIESKKEHYEGYTDYERAAEVTWRKQLPDLTPLARHLFQLTAFLLPDEIPRALFLHENDRHTMPPGNRRDALTELKDHHLIELHDGTIGIHRYIHGPLRRQMQGEEAKRQLSALLDQIYGFVPSLPDSFEYNSRPAWAPLAPHLHDCLDLAHAQRVESVAFLRLSTDVGSFYWNTGEFTKGETHLRRAYATYQNPLLSGESGFVTTCVGLATVLFAQGKYAEAESLFRRALQIWKETPVDARQEIPKCYGHIGNTLNAQGKFSDAERFYIDALKGSIEVYGAFHRQTAWAQGNLGRLYREQGNLQEAERLIRESLTIRGKELGPGHPFVARDCGHLAGVYRDQGRLPEAEELFRRQLLVDESAFGLTHPYTALDRLRLGDVIRDVDRREEANTLLLQAIDGLLERPDFEPKYLAYARWRLAQWHERGGDFAAARSEGALALALCTEALGAEHPDTRKMRQWLDGLPGAGLS